MANQTYKIKVKLHIHSCFASFASGDITLLREYDLPFTPFIGLELGDSEWSDVIKEIYYDTVSGEFSCWVDADKEYYNQGLHAEHSLSFHATPEMMNKKVEEYLKEGWRRDN